MILVSIRGCLDQARAHVQRIRAGLERPESSGSDEFGLQQDRTKRPLRKKPFAQRAVTPATCGVAMLVPLIVLVPPLSQALKTLTPGPATVAIVFENGATVSPPPPSANAATDVIPNAAAGGATLISWAGLPVRLLSLPAAATIIVV
jgi:hypothetical protein